jgi:hypothetical protein
MRTASLVLLLLAAAPAGTRQDPPKGPAKEPPKFKFDLKLSLEETPPKWTFVLEGTTDLPDGVALKARLLVLEEVDDFRGGKRVDEESMMPEPRGWRLLTLKGGKLRENLLVTPRKPYSLWYRARLTYDPDVQDNAILDKVGETEISYANDLHLGTPKDFERELAAAAKDLGREMEGVLALFRDLRGRFQVWTRKPDPAAFHEWGQGLAAKVEDLRKRNAERYSIWAVWLERQAKFRVDSFCERFDWLCRDFEEWLGMKARIDELSKEPAKHAKELQELKDGEQDRQLRILHGLDGFLAYFEESREALGIDTPTDPEAVGVILKDYEAAVEELIALAEKRDAEGWKARAPGARDRARRGLMRLTSPSLLPRRAYDRVLELTDKFRELSGALDRAAAGAEAPVPAAVEAHRRLLADFRKYAGIK